MINITLNSFGTDLQASERKKLYPEFGNLFPEGTCRHVAILCSLYLSRSRAGIFLLSSCVSLFSAFRDARARCPPCQELCTTAEQ